MKTPQLRHKILMQITNALYFLVDGVTLATFYRKLEKSLKDYKRPTLLHILKNLEGK